MDLTGRGWPRFALAFAEIVIQVLDERSQASLPDSRQAVANTVTINLQQQQNPWPVATVIRALIEFETMSSN